METSEARRALSEVLRPVTPGILDRIIDEAARASGARPDEVRALESLLRALSPLVLDAIAASDEERTQMLSVLTTRQLEMRAAVPPIPPVVRVGILEIGVRLGRANVAAAVEDRADGPAILREFDALSQQLRVATQHGVQSEGQPPR